MSAPKQPQTVTVFDPRNPERTREVPKGEVKRWERTGWTSTEPTAPESPEGKADGKS